MKQKIQSSVREYLWNHKSLNRQVKLLVKRHRARTSGHPDWSKVLDNSKVVWGNMLNTSKNGPKILIATSVGQHFAGTTLESILGVALTLRGADVHILLCDSILPACLACDVTWYPRQEKFAIHGPRKDICTHCFQPANRMFESLGLTVHRYSELISPDEQQWAEHLSETLPLKKIPDYVIDDCAVGEHAVAGALRFFARGTLDGEPYADPIVRRYFNSALLTTFISRRLFRKYRIETSVFHHGIYVPQGLIGEVARRENVRVVNWNPAYRKHSFIFSHNDTYHHTLMQEPVGKWESIKWGTEIEKDLMRYLKSRWQGSQDWIWFHERPQFDLSIITEETGIDFSKPCIGLLTNVLWDAQLHYPANVFSNMLDWIIQTISYFARRPELNLLIRVHPAEIHGTLRSRQAVVDEIKRVYPELPKNIFIIPPESRISTYVSMSQCDAVVIYGTKTGVELTSMGISVIVAGEAWIRNKGITLDASSVDVYFSLLDRLPLNERMAEKKVQRARKYAYHFFFRRMIPLEFLEPTGTNPPYRSTITDINQLLSGQSIGLDVICNGILKGDDFIYPAEEIEQCS